MSNFDEIIQTIKASLYDRLSNPLFFPFILAWFAFNAQLVMIFFSGEAITMRLHEYRLYLQTDPEHWRTLWYPLAFSFGYVLLTPFVLWPITWISERQNNAVKLVKLKAQRKEPVDQDKFAAIIEEQEKLKNERTEWQMKKLEMQNEQKGFVAQLEERLAEYNKLKTEHAALLRELEKETLKRKEFEAEINRMKDEIVQRIIPQ